MSKSYNEKINKYQDWGGDESTEGLPVSGERIQEFIKEQLDGKAGVFYYDTDNNRYIVFADTDTRDAYLEDPTQTSLIIGSFDAPFNYTASIALMSPSYVSLLDGTKNIYAEYTFDTVNKQGQSVGEPVIATYTFIKNGRKQVVNEVYQYGTQVRFKVDDYISVGTNYLQIGITGQNSLAATTIGVTYQVVDLQLSDSYNIASVYTPDSGMTAEIPFSIAGYGTKVMEWFVDGEQLDFVKFDDEVLDISTTRTKYIDLSLLGHGRHSIQARAYVVLDGEKFYSHTLYRDVIVNRGHSTDPIIAIATTIPSGQPIVTDGMRLYGLMQYVPYTLQFAVFNPTNSGSLYTQINIDGTTFANVAAANNQVNDFSMRLTGYGDNVLTIRSGNTTYDINVYIEKSSLAIEEIVSGLQLSLQAMGRTNNDTDKTDWLFGLYRTTFSGFEWNNQSGWNNNRLIINKGAFIDVNIAPFNTDITRTGATFEFEFSTDSVTDDDAVICDMRGETGAGILITASAASLFSSNGNEVRAQYMPRDNKRISFVVNRRTGVTNKGLVFVYINGECAGSVDYSTVDDFLSAGTLRFGNTEGAVIALKDIRFYTNALNDDQVLNNYTLYRDQVEDMFSVYDDNNIYMPGTQVLSVDAIAAKCPVIIVTGNVPELLATSDKNHTIYVDIDYINLQDPTRAFTGKGIRMRPQGTSSMGYPIKNFRFYTNYGTVWDYLGNIIPGGLYAFRQNAQPVTCLCAKADYADSSGTHNTGVARMMNDVFRDLQLNGEYVCRTEAQAVAIANNYTKDVRTTVDGFPVVILYRLTAESDLVFVGKYNLNNDKSTESVFGFTDIPAFDNSRVQCWEVLNNGNDIANFITADDFDSKWEDAFEARYPDGSKDISDLKELTQWLVSTRTNPDSFGDFIRIRSEVKNDGDTQYGSNDPYPEQGEFVDNARNRLDKFIREKWDYLDVYKMAATYVYKMRFAAVDQMVKNMMWTTEGTQGKGTKCKWFDILYDNDTINGVRNDGYCRFFFDIDRKSLDDSFASEVYAFAGPDSTLYNNLEADPEFMRIVSDIDNAMFMAGMSYANVIKMFNELQAGSWCTRIYNHDAQNKYIRPFTDQGINNLFMQQGSRSTHRQYWLSKRFDLYDSKYVSGEYKSKSIEFKVAAAPRGLTFDITAGSKLNYGYGVNNVVVESGHYLEVGQSHQFTTQQILNVGDPVRLYGARSLRALNLSSFAPYMSVINIADVYSGVTGTCLESLILGHDAENNLSLENISGITQATKLQHLNIRNFKAITSLDLANQNDFVELLASGSGLLGLVLPDGAPVRLLELPETMSALQLLNLPRLDSLILENNAANIRTIEIKSCPSIDTKNFLYMWFNNKTANDAVCSVSMNDIDWTSSSEEMDKLAMFMRAGGKLDLTGHIHVNATYTDVQLEEMNKELPNVIITCDELIITPYRHLLFLDSKNMTPIANVRLVVNDIPYISNENGVCKIRSGAACDYIIFKEGYLSMQGAFDAISEDKSETILLTPVPTRSFIIKDDEGYAIQDAKLTWNNEEFYSDVSGIINVVTEKGGDFIFSANGYRSVLISLDNIYADDSNTIVLYKVFQAYIEAADTHGKPLKNVDVTIDGTTKTTDDEGITSFDLVRGSYRITVSYSDEVLNEDIDITNQNVLLSYSFERSIIDKKPEENGNIQLLVKAQSLSNGLTVDSSSNDFTIYWGDGTSTEGKSGSRTYSHTYEYEDYWPIEITGSENITRANSTKAYLIAYWSIGNSNVNNLTFNGFNLMNAVGDVFKNDVSRTDFSSVFNECRNLKIIYESLFSKCIEATNFGSSFAWCGLKTIPKNMFKNQNKVTNFFQAFFRCTALLSMPADTFDFCPSVTNLRQVFQNCTSLKGGYMPANDNTPNYSGMFSACDSLQFIVSKSEIPPIFDHSGIADFNVYVPDESVELYKTASVWSRFSDRIYPMSKFAIDFPEAQDN